MNGEEDTCLLPPTSASDKEVDTVPCSIPFSPPSSHAAPFDFDYGSHRALQKAFIQLKRRLDETNSENQQLIWKLKALESAVSSAGESESLQDRTEGRSMAAEGEAGLQMAAEEGFTKSLQRQLARAQTQLLAVEKKYQEKVQESDHNLSVVDQQLREAVNQVELLSQENRTLQQKYEEEKQEKETVMQTVNDLREKCDSLQLEKEKLLKDEAALHYSLRKAEQEVAMLKEKQRETMQTEGSPELAVEVASMRKVIRNLREMVLAQRRHLGSCGKMLSMSSSPGPLQSTEGRSLHNMYIAERETSPAGSGRTGGSWLGQSREVVNVAHAPSLSTRQQQEQQQQQQLAAMKQRCVTSTSSAVNPGWDHQNMGMNTTVMGEPIVNGGVGIGKATVTNSRMAPKLWGSQSAVIQRLPDPNADVLSRSKTEVVRSNPSYVFRSPDYTDSINPSQHLLGDGQISPPPAPRLTPTQPTTAELKQLLLDPQATTEPVKGTAPLSKPLLRGVSPTSTMYPLQPLLPLLKDPPDVSNTDAYTKSTTAPSMHILNPGVMAGARVIRNEDSFGHSGETMLMGSHQQPGLTTTRERNGAGGSPSERVQALYLNSPAMSELSPYGETNFTHAPVINQLQPGLDRKCPVCGQDFSHISMDKFQTHVFDCFDRAEESSSAPKTLQPQTAVKPEAEMTDRVCPMCEKKFAEGTSQQFFEGHVQSHFEEVADQFEVLDPKEP